jgi:hypothetical protein
LNFFPALAASAIPEFARISESYPVAMPLVGRAARQRNPREWMKNFLREALNVGEEKNMTFHHIFDYEVQEKVPHVPKAVGKPYKFAPKEYTTESAIEVFGDHVVTFTGLGFGKLEDDLTIFVMVSPRLAESYRTWWQMMWDLLPEPSYGRGKAIRERAAKRGKERAKRRRRR